MLERLLHALAAAALILALALAMAVPNLVLFGWGHPLVAGTVHLVTLGAVLSGAYALQQRLWRALYGSHAPWMPLLWASAAFHALGLALLAWGFLMARTRLGLWGGHYLVPMGVLLSLAHGWVAAWRREPGRPPRLGAHLPGLGLAVAMALGALMVMEAATPRWGLYTPDTILAHLLCAAFLFVVPLLLLPGALAQQEAPPPAPAADAGARPAAPSLALVHWYGAVAAGATGVLLVALSLAGAGPPRLFAVGLAMLGALLVWLGLPSGGRLRGTLLVPVAGRLASGVVLFYAALRYARGPHPGDGAWLAKVGVLLFLLGVAVPELLALLERQRAHPLAPPPRPGETLARQATWLAGTAALVAGQLWLQPTLVQLGAALWLLAVAWHAAAAWRRA